jgi:hypothetical protein
MCNVDQPTGVLLCWQFCSHSSHAVNVAGKRLWDLNCLSNVTGIFGYNGKFFKTACAER